MGHMEKIREHLKGFEVDHKTAENAANRVLDWARSQSWEQITADTVIAVLLAAGVAAGPAGLAAAGVASFVILAITS